MSRFNLLFCEDKIDEPKVVAIATTFGIHLVKETKEVNGERRSVFYKFSDAGEIIGMAQDIRNESFEGALKYLESRPHSIKKLMKSGDYEKSGDFAKKDFSTCQGNRSNK